MRTGARGRRARYTGRVFALGAILLLFELLAAVGLVFHLRALRAHERDVQLDLLEFALVSAPAVEHPLSLR